MRDLLDKSKEEVLEDLLAHGFERDKAEYEQYAAAITVKSVQDLEASLDHLASVIKQAAQHGDKFSRRLYWLNVVLTAATVVGAVGTALATLPVLLHR